MSEQLRQGDPDPSSDMDGRLGESGTLDQGYGQSEQRGEEQWSRERYDEEARQVDAKVLDNLPEGERGDVDRMAGGMISPDESTNNESASNQTDVANEQMPGAW